MDREVFALTAQSFPDPRASDLFMSQEEVVAVSLTIEVTAGYRSITFAIRGDIDLATAPDLATAMAAIQDSYGRLVLDLSELDFIDSTGVRVLVQGEKHLADQGVKLELARVPRQAEKVFQLLGMRNWHRNEDILRLSTDAPYVAPQAGPHVR
jgi:anti-sigma B factor antagonist